MCAYWINNTDTLNKTAISTPNPLKFAKIIEQATIEGTQNNKLNSSLLANGINGLTGLLFVK